MNSTENSVQLAPPERIPDFAQRAAETSAELKRGAFLNTIATITANFRAIFTLLIARLLGPASLGIFSVVWSITDIAKNVGILGLDEAVTTFVARANASGDRVRAGALFRVAALLAVLQSAAVAAVAVFAVRFLGNRLDLEPEMTSALAVMLCAMPGIALYRISTSASRGMKVMKHDIYSRGLTESGITTLAFLAAFVLGARTFAPEIGAVIGTAASGIVAFALAFKLLPFAPNQVGAASHRETAYQLLTYALPIGADQFLNAFIWRLDIILLGWFVERVPGVTLTTLGIYGAVVGVANGLRKVSQAFTPIFTPVVAGMTATGQHEHARATYARLAQWMLWILLPFVTVLALADDTILLVYGPAFQQGSRWLTIVALACATNAFINLGETVIMVQRPGLNLLNSLITCALGGAVTLWLILRFGVTGAAFGILTTYLIQGSVRNIMLRFVFHWHNPWSNLTPPLVATFLAIIPAIILRTLIHGIPGQIAATIVFLLAFGFAWSRQPAVLKIRID